MTKEEIQSFLKEHPLSKISAAGIQYSIYKDPSSVNNLESEIARNRTAGVDEEHAKLIAQAETPQDFFRLMRKPMSWENQERLTEKMLTKEEDTAPYILKRSLTNMQDTFVETATAFFLSAKQDISAWILENYDAIQNAYMKSMYCMVLGVRGDESIAPILMTEYANFLALCPGLGFEQGPLLGLHPIVEGE